MGRKRARKVVERKKRSEKWRQRACVCVCVYVCACVCQGEKERTSAPDDTQVKERENGEGKEARSDTRGGDALRSVCRPLLRSAPPCAHSWRPSDSRCDSLPY